MSLIAFPLIIIAALVCAFLPNRLARSIAVLSFVLAAAPIPLTYLACAGAGGGCSGVPAGLAIAFFGPVFVGALAAVLWQARRRLTTTDLRQLPGWQEPSGTVRAAYLAALAVVGLNAGASLFVYLPLTGMAGSAGSIRWLVLLDALLPVLILYACAARAHAILMVPDALWSPKTGVRVRIVCLAAMTVGALVLAVPLVGKYVPAWKPGYLFLSLGTVGASLSVFLGLCAFELSRAKALR